MNTKINKYNQKGVLTICGFVNICKNKKCIHSEPHQFSDGCKGMCKTMGYADCRPIINKNK